MNVNQTMSISTTVGSTVTGQNGQGQNNSFIDWPIQRSAESLTLILLFLLGAPINLYCFYHLHIKSHRRRRGSPPPTAASTTVGFTTAVTITNNNYIGRIRCMSPNFAHPDSRCTEKRIVGNNSRAGVNGNGGGVKTNPKSKCSKSSLKYSAKFLVLQRHLNIADLLIVIFFTQAELWKPVLYSSAWTAEVLCKLTKFTNSAAFLSSSFIVSIIALDRALTIKVPAVQQNLNNIRLMLYASWALAFLFSLPQLFLWTVFSDRFGSRCISSRFVRAMDRMKNNAKNYSNQNQNQNITFFDAINAETSGFAMFYDIFHLLVIFWVPFLIIIICYLHVFFLTALLARRMRSTQHPSSNSDCIKQRINARRQQCSTLLKKGTLLVLVYVVCWFPYNFISAWAFVDVESYHNIKRIAFTYYLIVLNSVINPFVYRLMPQCFPSSISRRLSANLRSKSHLLRTPTPSLVVGQCNNAAVSLATIVAISGTEEYNNTQQQHDNVTIRNNSLSPLWSPRTRSY